MSISSSIGPVSGINYGTLITGLMAIEQRPLDLVTKQIKKVKEQSDALIGLSAQIASLKLAATSFTSSAIFRSTTATSSNTSILSATSTIGAPVGAYSFNVQRLAAATQLATQGFSSASVAIGQLGSIPTNADNLKLNQARKLSELNGGAGVPTGTITINTSDGSALNVDLSSAVTVQDVLDKIQAGTNISGIQKVTASIQGDKFVITDNTTGATTLNVKNYGSTTTATALGLTTTSAVGNTLTGADANRLALTTPLSQLNGGNGVRTNGSSTSADFTISSNLNGVVSTYSVSLGGSVTMGEVLNKINAAGTKDGKSHLTATLDPDGHSIQIAGDAGSTLTIAASGTSQAARDLGLTTPVSTGQTIHGQRINAGLNSALLRELNGGSGVGLGTILITNQLGTATTVDLKGAATVQDVLDKINTQSGTSLVTASLNASKTGINLVDTSGGTGNFTVSNGTSTSATDLGINQSVLTNSITGNDTKLRALGSGVMTFQLGRGALDDVAKLADLNGGKGVSKGSIRITDRSGVTATIDLSKAIDLNDVVDAINSTNNLSVVASLGGTHGDQLVLKDQTGKTTGNLTITNVGTATTATDLGLTAGTLSVDQNTLTGTDLNKLNLTTSLDLLNNANGVRVAGSNLKDFTLNYTGGSVEVSLTGAKTLGDILSKINAAANVGGVQKVTAALSADGHGISLTAADAGTGGTVSVTSLNASNALRDLGLLGTASTGVLTGTRLNNATNSPLLSELNGGNGIRLGSISITSHAGGTASTVDLSGAQTLNDVLNAINTQATGVQATLNSAKNGILLTDTTGISTGSLTVSGDAATDLGLAQTTTESSINSKDLHLRVMSDNTLLSTLNGGTGFKAGRIKITDSLGNTSVVDLTDPALNTLGSVIAKINANTTNVKAKMNANGNGILLTDASANGTMTAKVEDLDNTTAASSLNLAGSFTGATLDGSFQKTLTILGTDTLSEIANKITSANMGISASVINDGSGATPFRLNITSRNSGAAGRLVFDGSSLGLNTTTLVTGQDAVVSYGSSGSTSGLQATSSSNSFSTLVPGLTLNLNSLGSATVTVSRDDSKISTSVQSFTDSYNKVITSIATLTKFEASNTANNGVLFGNSTVELIQQSLGNFISKTFSGVGSLTNLGSVGISVNQDASITLDTDKLQSMLSTKPDDVRTLFTAKAGDTSHPNYGGVGVVLGKLADQFTDAQTGSLFRATDAYATQTRQLNDRSNNLNALLTAKRNRLIKTYANLEVTIAKLQSQSSALTSFTSTKNSSSSSSSSSSS